MQKPTKVTIENILTGEPVSPAVANRPHLDLEENIDNLINYIDSSELGQFDYDPGNTSGLNFAYTSGKVITQDPSDPTRELVYEIPAGSIAVIDNETTYLAVKYEYSGPDPIQRSIGGVVKGRLPLYKVEASGGSIVSVTDLRTHYKYIRADYIPVITDVSHPFMPASFPR